jgi:hypothetical protein
MIDLTLRDDLLAMLILLLVTFLIETPKHDALH